ncbi:hypothetical protein EJ05DRAFT_518764 [Pseudovirgaria hyperparasitica]|uniref:Uncharacterized protein n=1 Tax=Pseudovirgaria hyperparasitica TaxID=470096 RepID=A0A6A6W1Z9_9PEZI|nr:uncharacterized protein EJ05DRAFT_518764 [Pseudovirgaria hyperparasitica]KAF2756139.1 hypothetical protein EJ05DRAFT_518764 [Pseudovirgaria hyperparasitica]
MACDTCAIGTHPLSQQGLTFESSLANLRIVEAVRACINAIAPTKVIGQVLIVAIGADVIAGPATCIATMRNPHGQQSTRTLVSLGEMVRVSKKISSRGRIELSRETNARKYTSKSLGSVVAATTRKVPRWVINQLDGPHCVFDVWHLLEYVFGPLRVMESVAGTVEDTPCRGMRSVTVEYILLQCTQSIWSEGSLSEVEDLRPDMSSEGGQKAGYTMVYLDIGRRGSVDPYCTTEGDIIHEPSDIKASRGQYAVLVKTTWTVWQSRDERFACPLSALVLIIWVVQVFR